MRYCVNVPIFGQYADVRVLAAMAREAEYAGWDGFFVWDHLQWSGENDGEPRQPSIDPWITLAAIVLNTTHIKIGPMVTPVARRRPWKLAREAVTVDHLSNGRLILGVGLGFPAGLEFTDFGEDGDAKVRAEKLDEGLDVLVGLWSGEPFSYNGKHYTLTNAQFLPKPMQQPCIPIWVAGEWPHARAPFRRAARWDGVQPGIDADPARTPAEIEAMCAYITQHRTSTTPFDVVVAGQTTGDGSMTDRQIVQAYADAGVTWWMEAVSHWRGPLDQMRQRIRQGPPRI
jgi:alkanesulfonate monooxygenase SsuD/methylene tetrahydromethanopterin reductase-like flavin-dependent oxidoreductase (luciferase family)